MKVDRRNFLLAMAATAGCKPSAQGPRGHAFIANAEGRSIAVVNLSSFSLVRQIPLDANPTELIAHPSQPVVLVLTPATATIHEIDAAAMVVRRRSRIPGAQSMRLAPDGAAVWVLCREPRALTRLELDRWDTAARIRLPAQPADFDLSETGKAAISLPSEGSIAIANLEAARIEHVTRTGADPRIVRFRPDGQQVLAGNRGDRTVSVIDAASGRLVVNLPLAFEPDSFCFRADRGGILFISGMGMDAVASLYPYRHLVAETLLAGRQPGAMAVTAVAPDRPDFLFVANPASGDVTILDITTSKVVAVVQVGTEPSHITITPDDQYALVVNRRGGDLAVIWIAALRDKRSKPAPAPLLTMIRVGAGPASAVVRAG